MYLYYFAVHWPLDAQLHLLLHQQVHRHRRAFLNKVLHQHIMAAETVSIHSSQVEPIALKGQQDHKERFIITMST